MTERILGVIARIQRVAKPKFILIWKWPCTSRRSSRLEIPTLHDEFCYSSSMRSRALQA
eukprot:IDg19387t1